MFLLMCSAEWMMIISVLLLVMLLVVLAGSMLSHLIFDLTIICTPTRGEFKYVNRNQ